MGLLSYVEITVSRPYKELKRAAASLPPHPTPLPRGEREQGEGGMGGPATDEARQIEIARSEKILKGLSLGVILLGVGMMLWRLTP